LNSSAAQPMPTPAFSLVPECYGRALKLCITVCSYRANAQGEPYPLVNSHECYRALGGDEQGRQAAYRELFRSQLDPGLVDEIRKPTNGNCSLGNSRFQEQVIKALGCRVVRGRSGRPKREVDAATGDFFGSGRS
jgi:putative transposase